MTTKHRMITTLPLAARALFVCVSLSLAACAGDLGTDPAGDPTVAEESGAEMEAATYVPSADPALEAELVAKRDSHCGNSELDPAAQDAHEKALAAGTLRRQSRFARLAAESAHELEPRDPLAAELTEAEALAAAAAMPEPPAEILARQREYLHAAAAGAPRDLADLAAIKGQILDGE